MSRSNSPNSEINFTTGDKDQIGKNNVQLLKLKRDIQDHGHELDGMNASLTDLTDQIRISFGAQREWLERIDKDHRDIINRIINLEKGLNDVVSAIDVLMARPIAVTAARPSSPANYKPRSPSYSPRSPLYSPSSPSSSRGARGAARGPRRSKLRQTRKKTRN